MAPAGPEVLRPATAVEAAQALRAAAAEGRTVRVAGGRTRRDWGRVVPDADVELSTDGLGAIVEHNQGDFTAVVGAGVRLARAQESFAAAGQMLAVDPPADPDGSATLGGMVATADSGPLRHRYHALRDLVIGITVALPDGTAARAGGKVIKNVAGYDLAKLLTGSFGTLGVICEVVVRLHPRPGRTATAHAQGDDPAAVAAAAVALAHRPLEPLALDVDWDGGRGRVLVRFGGRTAADQARGALDTLHSAGLEQGTVDEEDEGLWERQRRGQRAGGAGAIVRVAASPRRMGDVLAAAAALGARVVARGGLGHAWVGLAPAEPAGLVAAIGDLRRRLDPLPATVLDAPAAVREALDPWPEVDGDLLELMRRVKERFDPGGTCNRGIFVGGL